jgi:hypothetical protein
VRGVVPKPTGVVLSNVPAASVEVLVLLSLLLLDLSSLNHL